MLPFGLSVIVSLNVPICPVVRVTSWLRSSWPAARLLMAAKPALVNGALPAMLKFPASRSAGPAAALTTPRFTTIGADPLATVPSASVAWLPLCVSVPPLTTSNAACAGLSTVTETGTAWLASGVWPSPSMAWVPSETRPSTAVPVMVAACPVEKVTPSVWASLWPGAMSAVGPAAPIPRPPVVLATEAIRFSE